MNVVATMMTMARQIAASEAFARDAMHYANLASDLEEHDTGKALRAQVVARRVEVLTMRAAMSELATVLTVMPVEAE